MRNKDVLKKLKNLPDNTKEYIDNKVPYVMSEEVVATISNLDKDKINQVNAGTLDVYETSILVQLNVYKDGKFFIRWDNNETTDIPLIYSNGYFICDDYSVKIKISASGTSTYVAETSDGDESYKVYIYQYSILNAPDIQIVYKYIEYLNEQYLEKNLHIQRNISVGGTVRQFEEPTEDEDLTTKKYVDDTADTLVKQDTNKYILICNDDTLVINKTDITDLSDATITIDNLTGQFGTLVGNDDGTYTYTLNTIMTDVETFTFKVNNVEQKLVIVPYREMKYNDDNAGITYDDKWTIEEDSKHYKGNAHKIENQIGTSTIIFKGTGIDVYTKISPISGTSTIDIYNGIGSKKEDGKYKPSLYTNYIENNNDIIYYQQPTISVKKLDFNTYTVEIMGGISNSTYYLDYIVIYNTLGTDLNDSIRKLYYAKDNSIGLLRTDTENPRFDPTRLYDPTTKKYVDDLMVANKTAICTDEEVNDMLNEVLGGDYSGN